MNRLQLTQRVRSLARDFSNSIFREQDIIDYINEGIDRCRQITPEFDGMTYLLSNSSSPILLPSAYHHLLAVYSSSRCYAQDERNYQASTLMNEFEVKMEDLRIKIENGEVVITDTNGNVVTRDNDIDYVDSSYFYETNSDLDDGVEGVS